MAVLLMDLVERFQVWRKTRQVVRNLAQANGLEIGADVKADIARQLRTGYETLKASSEREPFSSYVARLERALTEQLPRAPLWGGLHPPVDMIGLSRDEFRDALSSICPLWPFC